MTEPTNESPVRLLWGYRWWIAAIVVAVTLATYIASARRPDRYAAGSEVLVVSGAQSAGAFVDPAQLQQLTNIEDQLARTRDVAAAAVGSLPPGTTVRTVQHHVSVAVDAFLQQITITGRGASPSEAATYANAYNKAFVDYVGATGDAQRTASIAPIEQQIAQIEAQLGSHPPANENTTILNFKLQSLQTKLTELSSAPVDTVRVIQPAVPPTSPASPRPKRDAALGFLAALLACVAAVIVRIVSGDHFQSAEEASAVLGLPVLAELPRQRGQAAAADEAFRVLRTGVRFAMRDVPHPVVVVTGASPGVGKTFVTTNLAWAVAAGGGTVSVVDGDLRHPAVHDRFRIDREPGLGDALTADGSADELAPQEIKLPASATDREGALSVVTAGQTLADPAEALAGHRIGDLLDRLSQGFELVLVDTPPLAVVDPVVVSRFADGVLLVIDARRDKRRQFRRSLQALLAVDAAVIGFVFNGSKTIPAGSYQYASLADDTARPHEPAGPQRRLVLPRYTIKKPAT